MPLNPAYARAIGAQESGGRYDALGPVTKTGDRAYGFAQVMGNNVGPWTEKHYGERLTPQEFLANKEAQNAVFNGVFGDYVQKYGPEGAAKAWFAGEKGMNNPNAKDILGTSVSDYGQKFLAGLGQQPQASAPVAPQAAPDMGSWYQPQQAMPQMAAPAAPQGALGNMAQAPQQSQGVLPAQTSAPPDFEDLAGLLKPLQMKQRAPMRGLSAFRG